MVLWPFGKWEKFYLPSAKFIPNALVDGDDVRKYVVRLSYSETDRKVQTKRILRISKIVIQNNMFPISTVTMKSDLLSECNKLQIEVVLLNRPIDQISRYQIYNNENNVVGKDIVLEEFETKLPMTVLTGLIKIKRTFG